MDIQFLVERIETLIVNARKLPMTNNVVLDQAVLLDVIDQLRTSIPEEVRRARRIEQDSDRVLAQAREESERIIAAAQEQAAVLLQDHTIIREAESRAAELEDRAAQRADDTLRAAQQRAEETMRGADQYAGDVLLRLQADLEKTLSIVRKSLEVLEERKADTAEV